MAVLAACGGNGSGSPSSIDTSKVDANQAKQLNGIFGPGGKEGGSGVTLSAGMLLAMTGQGSFFGKVMSRGANLAAAQIKVANGITYDIHIADHKSGDVPAALSGTRQLVTQEKIKILQTPYGAPSEAIVPLIAQSKLLSFNGGGSSPGQVGKPFLWQTRMIFGDDPCPGGLAWLHKQFPKATKLAIIGTQENGVAGAKTIAPAVWKQLTGGTVVANEQHDVGATDFGSIVARIKSSGPDAILTFSFGDDVGYLVKQLREAQVTVPIMGIEFTDQAAKVAGDTYNTYNFATDFYDPTNPNPWNKIFVDGRRGRGVDHRLRRPSLGADPGGRAARPQSCGVRRPPVRPSRPRVGVDPKVRILPFRGEYSELVPARAYLVRGLIYSVPDPDLPLLGDCLTRGLAGGSSPHATSLSSWPIPGRGSSLAATAAPASARSGDPWPGGRLWAPLARCCRS